eukprot:3948665-Prymnesium_polylepis.1
MSSCVTIHAPRRTREARERPSAERIHLSPVVRIYIQVAMITPSVDELLRVPSISAALWT